jgi:hypothetical protein
MQGEGEDGDGDGDVVFVSRSGCSALLCAQASTGMRAAFAAFAATHVQAMEEKREVRRRGGGVRGNYDAGGVLEGGDGCSGRVLNT